MASLVAYDAEDSSGEEDDTGGDQAHYAEEPKVPSEDDLLHLRSDSQSFKKLINNTQLALAPTVVTKVSQSMSDQSSDVFSVYDRPSSSHFHEVSFCREG